MILVWASPFKAQSVQTLVWQLPSKHKNICITYVQCWTSVEDLAWHRFKPYNVEIFLFKPECFLNDH